MVRQEKFAAFFGAILLKKFAKKLKKILFSDNVTTNKTFRYSSWIEKLVDVLSVVK